MDTEDLIKNIVDAKIDLFYFFDFPENKIISIKSSDIDTLFRLTKQIKEDEQKDNFMANPNRVLSYLYLYEDGNNKAKEFIQNKYPDLLKKYQDRNDFLYIIQEEDKKKELSSYIENDEEWIKQFILKYKLPIDIDEDIIQNYIDKTITLEELSNYIYGLRNNLCSSRLASLFSLNWNDFRKTLFDLYENHFYISFLVLTIAAEEDFELDMYDDVDLESAINDAYDHYVASQGD